MFHFSWIKYDNQVQLEIAPISKTDAEKITDENFDRFFLGRKKNTTDKWFLVGEHIEKKKVIRRLSRREVRRMVGA